MIKFRYHIFILILITIIGYLAYKFLDQKSKNDYHFSKMYEYQTLSLISQNFPIGTSLSDVISQLNLHDSTFVGKNGSGFLGITPELPISKNLYKDYSGFYLNFKDSSLIWIEPVGPDYAGNEISIKYLKENLKFHLWNKP